MSIYTDILKKYWGYASFRSLQEEIITSVAEGKDTLGLMPTGGGKSVTFQVYSMSVPGVCIVITPLISLMKDQVENLQQRGIKAVAIHSQMNRREVEQAFKNVAYGDYKFLYISPERIASMQFKEKLAQLHVNLLAVDEAHCVSQWGYDFRPSYLEIKTLRFLLPHEVPVLALTATATPTVVEDIQKQLDFEQPNVLKKSYYRDNLIYIVRNREDKMDYLLKSVHSVSGSGVVYMRSRKKTKEIAELLQANGIVADYYHAGLSAKVRNQKQEDWMKGRTRIIVATNAFGMGIDKADVRFVIHLAPPDSLEAYFQEAGRAGRDGKRAYALLIASGIDKAALKRKVGEAYPPVDFVINVYNLMCSYLQIAIGTGLGYRRDFDVYDFCSMHKFSVTRVMSSLKILQSQGWIEFSQSSNMPARVHFKWKRDELYRFNIPNPKLEEFVRVLLRFDGGFFSSYVAIDEETLAKRTGISKVEAVQFLNYLSSLRVLHYIPKRTTPFVTFVRSRLDYAEQKISKENYHDRIKDYEKRIEATIDYTFSNDTCRSVMLLRYFGEQDAQPCGKCDVCKENGVSKAKSQSTTQLANVVKCAIQSGADTVFDISKKTGIAEKDLHPVIRQMLSVGMLQVVDTNRLKVV